MNYVPLEVHSSYSLLQSPTRIPDLVKAAKQRGYTALALTDENVLYGAVDFYNTARQAGLKPLLGLQIMASLGDVAGSQLKLTLLAKNERGYRNLMDLSTRQQTTDQRTEPLVRSLLPRREVH